MKLGMVDYVWDIPCIQSNITLVFENNNREMPTFRVAAAGIVPVQITL